MPTHPTPGAANLGHVPNPDPLTASLLLRSDAVLPFTAPKIGDPVTIRGLACRIFRIHPAGVIDVEEIDGARAFRVSGCPFSAL